ncbi:MAG: class I SAM-dependent methyltransferase [Pseudomonadota bacterium]
MAEPPSKDHDPAAAWDARYAAQPAPFGDRPTEGLAVALAEHPWPGPGQCRALALADGDGRNGTWLAQRGCAVTAVDVSPQATRQATARDAAAGVAVARVTADLAHWAPPAAGFDLAALLFLQGPPALRQAGLDRAAEALQPGGLLVLEGFAGAPDAEAPLGPDDPARRWTAADVARDARWHALDAVVRVQSLADGPRHTGLGRILWLTARRR